MKRKTDKTYTSKLNMSWELAYMDALVDGLQVEMFEDTTEQLSFEF